MADGSERGNLAVEKDYRSAFKSRDFRLYQMARLMVILGAEAQSVAVAWQVYALTHSALDLGYTGLALFLPGLFVMLAAGHAADRYDRRKIILLCYGLQACCTAVLLWLSLSATALQHGRIWPIYAVLVGIGLGRAFSGPAASAMLPSLVPKEDFVNAVTWGATVYQIANMSGPAVGGLLFTLPLAGAAAMCNGAPLVYGFTLTMLLGFIVLVSMIRAKMVTEKKAFSMKTVLAGLEYVWRAKLLLGSISLDLFAVLLGGATALLPIFATDILHAGPRGLGLLRAMPSVGALGGFADDGRAADQAQGRTDDVGVRRDLRCRDGGVWVVKEHLVECGGVGDRGRKRYGECCGSVERAAAGDAAGDAWSCERGELAVYRGVQRVWRI